jgi:hypothetical protein
LFTVTTHPVAVYTPPYSPTTGITDPPTGPKFDPVMITVSFPAVVMFTAPDKLEIAGAV